jgi:hypothetical protein
MNINKIYKVEVYKNNKHSNLYFKIINIHNNNFNQVNFIYLKSKYHHHYKYHKINNNNNLNISITLILSFHNLN